MRKIVFDIETSNVFSEVGKADPTALDISVVCLYDSETDEYKSFLQEDFSELWPIIEHADMLIGYNSDHFDIPLLNKYYPGNLEHIKSLDILAEIKKASGRRFKLDSVAKATLGHGKTGNGLEAITWWKNGEVQKVIDYCLADVRVTKEVYDFAREHNYLLFEDFGSNKPGKIELDTAAWEENESASMTHTLPF